MEIRMRHLSESAVDGSEIVFEPVAPRNTPTLIKRRRWKQNNDILKKKEKVITI